MPLYCSTIRKLCKNIKHVKFLHYHTNKELPQELNEKTTNTTTKTNKQRTNPVKESMQSLITAKPTITKTEMWAEFQKMARANTPPFIDEKDEHTLIFVTGGNAESDTKILTKGAFGKRYDRIKLTLTADKSR